MIISIIHSTLIFFKEQVTANVDKQIKKSSIKGYLVLWQIKLK